MTAQCRGLRVPLPFTWGPVYNDIKRPYSRNSSKHAVNPAFTMASFHTLPAESLEPSVNPYVSLALTEAPLRYLNTNRPSQLQQNSSFFWSNARGHSHSKTWRTPQFAAWCTGVPPFRVWRWWKLEIARQYIYCMHIIMLMMILVAHSTNKYTNIYILYIYIYRYIIYLHSILDWH